MANSGYALYSKEKNMYIFPVAYEYPDSRFVGFDPHGTPFLVHKLNQEQKEWLKNNNPNKSQKLKNYIFGINYYAVPILWDDESRPKGKPYTQLPGGGGGYKATRQYTSLELLMKDPTVEGIFDRFFITKENIRFAIRNILNEMFESEKVSFTAVSIEEESEINKINNLVSELEQQNKISIPDNFYIPKFPDGKIDYHMTIIMGVLPYYIAKQDLGKETELNIIGYGVSPDAVALLVSGDYFSVNKNQHITVAYKTRPADSKDIQNWEQLETPIKVRGVIRQFDIDKNVVDDVFISEDREDALLMRSTIEQPAPQGMGSKFPYQV